MGTLKMKILPKTLSISITIGDGKTDDEDGTSNNDYQTLQNKGALISARLNTHLKFTSPVH